MNAVGFLQKIRAKYDAAGGADLRALTPGGFYITHAPANVSWPCLVVNTPSAYGETLLDGSSDEYPLIQISGYCRMVVDANGDGVDDRSGGEHLIMVRDAIMALYCGKKITWSTGSEDKVASTFVVSPGWPRHDPTNDGYAVDVQIRCILSGEA